MVHIPATQAWPVAQVVPQAPQLNGSVLRVAHRPLQMTWVFGQLTWVEVVTLLPQPAARAAKMSSPATMLRTGILSSLFTLVISESSSPDQGIAAPKK